MSIRLSTLGVVLALALGAGVLAALAVTRQAPTGASGKRLSVCASIYPLYEWARAVAGPDADVHLLEGGGADPHHFTPSPRDSTRMARSRALLVVGLGLDPWIQRATAPEGRARAMELWETGAWVRTRKAGLFAHRHAKGADNGPNREEGAERGEASARGDPHVWLDPRRGAVIVKRLGEAFARLDPEHAAAYRARAARQAGALNAFARELDAQAAPLAGKKIVTYHDAYGYLLDRLGVELAGVVQGSPGVEPSLRDVVEAARKMRAIGQRAVFAEPGHEEEAAPLAREMGGPVVLLDPLVRPVSPCGKTYLERMRHNVKVLREHLR